MRSPVRNSMKPLEWSLLIILSILWGGSFFFSKVAVAELGPFTIVLARVGIGAIALNLVVIATGRRMPTSLKTWGSFLIMGAINNLIPFSLIFWGQTQIASGLASILNASAPLWTVLLAHVLTKDERLTPSRLLGVLFGLGGAVVVIGPDALGGPGLNVLAQLAILGAAISYAFAGIFGKRFAGRSPYETAAGQVTCAALMMVPVALVVDRPWQTPAPSAVTVGALLALGLLCTAVAYIIYFRLLATAGATNLLLVTFLIPVSAVLLGTAFLGERLGLSHFLGMGLISLGLAAIDGRFVSYLQSRLQRQSPRARSSEDYAN